MKPVEYVSIISCGVLACTILILVTLISIKYPSLLWDPDIEARCLVMNSTITTSVCGDGGKRVCWILEYVVLYQNNSYTFADMCEDSCKVSPPGTNMTCYYSPSGNQIHLEKQNYVAAFIAMVVIIGVSLVTCILACAWPKIQKIRLDKLQSLTQIKMSPV